MTNTQERTIAGYEVVCTKTGAVLKRYTAEQGKLASRFCDKKDKEYGAICTNRRIVWA